ncbi:MAG: hypothetical protein K8U03_18705 [Planctomycetia bacterium]|nr:hypothetical protein [Planctomycetia bacterium]
MRDHRSEKQRIGKHQVRKQRAVWACAGTCMVLCGWTVWAADSSKKAPPPKFDAGAVGEIFFKDARQQLIGEPPVAGANAPVGGGPASPGGGGTAAASASSDGNAWSALITGDTLEAEIKSQPGEIDKALKAANPHKSARMVVTYLAALYNVIFKYDKDVRWKGESQPLRDNFAKAGNNLKAWTDSQKKQVAKLKTDLSELIQGNAPALTASLDGEAPWLEIADRTPIMHRLEIGQQEHLNAWTKDADAVKKNKDAVIREAEVMAMLARVIQDKSYEFTDDETYMGFAKALEKHASDAVAAAKSGDAAAAGSAVAKMQKACDDCHGGFR